MKWRSLAEDVGFCLWRGSYAGFYAFAAAALLFKAGMEVVCICGLVINRRLAIREKRCCGCGRPLA